MARARNLKPGFFGNEDLAECSIPARLCFAGLWTLADREGRLEDRPKRIKGALFPFDTIDIEPLLRELAKWGFIERYAVDGRRLIQIPTFLKHQNPHHREPESSLPPPESLRLEPDATTPKPEALLPSDAAKAHDKPRNDVARSDLASGSGPPVERGSSRAESGLDESGAMNPEPPIRSPESGVLPQPTASALPAPSARKRAKKADPPAGSATWDAYAAAYRERYQVDPVRNAKANAQFMQLVARLGAEEAPKVAAAYLSNRNALYIAAKHGTDLLLRDAEKLRTEWATGIVTYNRDAAEADRLASTGAMWDRVGSALAAKGIN